MDIEITRVNYFDGQYLGPADFTDEQAYHLAMRRRHLIAHHTWGIVRGLVLTVDPTDNEVSITPGFAVDGYGRELILPQKFVIPSSDFALYGDQIAVVLEYDRIGTDPAVSGDCDPAGFATGQQNAAVGKEARNALLVAADAFTTTGSGTLGLLNALETIQSLISDVQNRVNDTATESNARWREVVRVNRMTFSEFDPANLSGTRDLAPAVHDFSPTMTPPDDPATRWQVYLGSVTRDPDTLTYRVDLSNRPYAGLRGESVIAPSGEARVMIGDDPADKAHRFSVYTVDPKKDKPDKLQLAVNSNGRVDLEGHATLSGGNLTIVDGGVEFIAGVAGLANARTLSRPWRIYRETTKAEPDLSNSPVGAPSPSSPPPSPSPSPPPPTPSPKANGAVSKKTAAFDYDGLFIEIPIAETAAKATNQVVIGSSKDAKFFPALTVDQDGTVTVHGNLIVGGTMTVSGKGGFVKAGAAPLAQSVAAGSAAQAVSSAVLGAPGQSSANDIEAVRRLITGDLPTLVQLITTSDNARNAVAEQLAQDSIGTNVMAAALVKTAPASMDLFVDSLKTQSGLDAFAQALAANPDGRKTITDRLADASVGTDAMVVALLKNTGAGMGRFVDSLTSQTGMETLAGTLADKDALGDFVDKLKGKFAKLAKTFTDPSGSTRLDNLLNALLDPSASDQLMASLKTGSTSRMAKLIVSLFANLANTSFVDTLLVDSTSLGAFLNGIKTSSDMGTLVDALSKTSMDNLVSAFTASRMNRFTDSLIASGNTPMVTLAASLSRETPASSNTFDLMKALITALAGPRDSSGKFGIQSPGMIALVKSLDDTTDWTPPLTSLLNVEGASKPFINEIVRRKTLAAPTVALYPKIALSLKLGLVPLLT